MFFHVTSQLFAFSSQFLIWISILLITDLMFIYAFSFLFFFFLKSLVEVKVDSPSGSERAVAAGGDLLF